MYTFVYISSSRFGLNMAEIQDFKDLLTNAYKIHISNEDYERLTKTMSLYGVGHTNCSIELISNLATLAASTHLINNVKLHRMHTNIVHDEILYEMKPIIHSSYLKADIAYPKRVNVSKDKEADLDLMKKEQNIILIRTIEIEISREYNYEERFSLIVFNPSLDVRGGIKFESIKE